MSWQACWLCLSRLCSLGCSYTNQVLGNGADQHLFYTDAGCRAAYKAYLNMLMNRVNTVTGKSCAAVEVQRLLLALWQHIHTL